MKCLLLGSERREPGVEGIRRHSYRLSTKHVCIQSERARVPGPPRVLFIRDGIYFHQSVFLIGYITQRAVSCLNI